MPKEIIKPIMIVANEAFYDDEKQLYGCYIGLDDKKRTLICTVWGKTEQESLENGRAILEKLGN